MEPSRPQRSHGRKTAQVLPFKLPWVHIYTYWQHSLGNKGIGYIIYNVSSCIASGNLGDYRWQELFWAACHGRTAAALGDRDSAFDWLCDAGPCRRNPRLRHGIFAPSRSWNRSSIAGCCLDGNAGGQGAGQGRGVLRAGWACWLTSGWETFPRHYRTW